MLEVNYAPHIPQALIDVAEHHARLNGVSLDALERIGESLDFVEQFIIAAEDGDAYQYAEQFLGRHEKQPQVERARVVAARLFGTA